MPDLTQQQKKNYIELGADYCPLCKGDYIKFSDMRQEGGVMIVQEGECNGCGAEWSETYVLSEVELDAEVA